jgi:hypothetical protein
VVFVCALLHSAHVTRQRGTLLKYFIFGALLYIIDRLLRLYRGRCRHTQLISVRRDKTELTRIAFRLRGGLQVRSLLCPN